MIRSLRMQPNRKLYFKEVPMPPTPGPGAGQNGVRVDLRL